MNKLAFTTLLLVLLAGCANTGSKQASIEDRGIEAGAASTTEAVQSTEQTSSGMQTAGVKPVESTTQAMAGRAGAMPAEAASAEKVETRGLGPDSTQVKPLAGNESASGAAGTEAAAAPVISLDLKDPHSPLAQRRIQFDYNSAAIRDEYRNLLEAHAQYLMNNSSAKVMLQGHTDERGSREYNLALGQRRAESVFKALNLLGVPEAQMEAVSLGEEKPLVEGHDEAAWAQNRRVEIIYQGE